MITKLGDAMSLPLAARNQLLAHAGFAMRYPQRKWEAEEMAPIRAAVDYTLKQHAPYPAFAVDRHWTLLQLNGPAQRLFGLMGGEVGVSLIDLMLDDSAQSMIENWPDVAHHSAHRLRTESAAVGGDPVLDSAADALARTSRNPHSKLGPVVPTIYRASDLRLSLFSTIAQFGTPEDLTLDDLKIEMFFPNDAASDLVLKQMA